MNSDVLVSVKTAMTKNPSEEAEKIFLNIPQRSMYRRLMYGFYAYSPEQLRCMSEREKHKIRKDYGYAKKLLHAIKAKKYHVLSFNMLNAAIPHAKLGEYIEDYYGLEIPKKVSIHSLNISVREICRVFIRKGLLPKEFFILKESEVKL